MKITFNFKPDSKVTLATNGQTETVDLWGRAHRLLEGHAGRINVYDQPLSAPSTGQAVARSDGKTTLNLLDETGPAEVSATLGEGRKALVRASARAQKRGFASGDYYWLAQDANGRFKPEPGRRHRKIHVSGAPTAMTRAAIAAHAGVAETAVTGSWLAARPHYGATPAMAMTVDVYFMLEEALWSGSQEARSDWVFFERGHVYTPLRTYGQAHLRGESELHPIVWDAYGTGHRPEIARGMEWIQLGPRFMMFRNLNLRKFNPRHGHGVIFENCKISGTSESQLTQVAFATMRECIIHDIVPDKSKVAGATVWYGSEDRISGIYASEGHNLMFDGCLFDRNGWAEGYAYDRDITFPYPPSDRNHNLYIQYDSRDVTMRHNLISRGASAGLQIRCGGHYDQNLFVDNNYATGLQAGTKLGPINQFTSFIDNVNFGAGYKRVQGYQGAINWGYDINTVLTAMVGNIVAHLADPDNPAEIADRKMNVARPQDDGVLPYNSRTTYIDNDTKVWRWERNADGTNKPQRCEGLNATTLDQTTIQRFAADFLDLPVGDASIEDLMASMRDESEYTVGDTVREAVSWAKGRFGDPIPNRTTPTGLTFLPDPRTEGRRWDNRLNWTTRDLPGTHVADTANLDGNAVQFGTLETSVAALESGGGTLDVTSGRLTLGALTDAAHVTVRNSGQLWCGATDQPLSVKASSGRIRLTGAVSNLALEARGRAEVLFGPNATIPAGKSLVISGQRPLVGWDGTGSATLTVAGTLEFRAGVTLAVGGTLQRQRLIHVGRRVETASFAATIADYEERTRTSDTNHMVLSDITGLPVTGDSFVYGVHEAPTDGSDKSVPQSATVTSILSRGVAPLQRFRSGCMGDGLTDPTVAVSLVLAAGSKVVITRRDLLAAGTHDLTGPGVTVTNQGATLPDGVTVAAGKLVLVVN